MSQDTELGTVFHTEKDVTRITHDGKLVAISFRRREKSSDGDYLFDNEPDLWHMLVWTFERTPFDEPIVSQFRDLRALKRHVATSIEAQSYRQVVCREICFTSNHYLLLPRPNEKARIRYRVRTKHLAVDMCRVYVACSIVRTDEWEEYPGEVLWKVVFGTKLDVFLSYHWDEIEEYLAELFTGKKERSVKPAPPPIGLDKRELKRSNRVSWRYI